MSISTVQLGDLVEIQKGKKADRLFERPTSGFVRYLQIDDLRPDAKPKYVEPFDCPVATTADVVIAWDGANAGTVSYNLHGHIGSTLAILRPKAELLAPYLSRFLQSKFDYLQANSTGATIPHVSKNALESLQVPLSSIYEQQRIAERLEQAERLCRTRRYALELSDTFLPAAFLELFGEPTVNPRRFPVATLEDELDGIESGFSPVCEGARTSSDQWAVLGLGSVTTGMFKPEENKLLPPEILPRPEIEVKHGDVLVTRKNTYDLVAASVLVRHPPPRLLLPDTIFRFALKRESRLLPEYLWAVLSSWNFRKRVQSLASGSAGSMPNISKEKFMGVALPVPPLPMQQKFATLVERQEQLRAGQREAWRQAEHLFQSLIHQAFTVKDMSPCLPTKTIRRKLL